MRAVAYARKMRAASGAVAVRVARTDGGRAVILHHAVRRIPMLSWKFLQSAFEEGPRMEHLAQYLLLIWIGGPIELEKNRTKPGPLPAGHPG